MVGFDGLPVVLSAQALAQVTASVELPTSSRSSDSKIPSPTAAARARPAAHGAAPPAPLANRRLGRWPCSAPEQLKKALVIRSRSSRLSGVGESLILSESLKGIQKLDSIFGLNTLGMPGAGAEVDANELLLPAPYLPPRPKHHSSLQGSGQVVGAHFAFESRSARRAVPDPFAERAENHRSARSKLFRSTSTRTPTSIPGIYASANALSAALRTDPSRCSSPRRSRPCRDPF